MATTVEIEKLAAEIGENIYIDVAKWHLYLSDAHLHTALAQQLYPLLESKDLDKTALDNTLQGMSVALGGGKVSLPLSDLIPDAVQGDLMKLLEDYQDQV
ncbi:MAG: DUF3181 family protein [Microcoleaceae cyanobacterium]